MVIDFHTHTFPDTLAPRAVASLSEKSRSRAFTDGTEGGLLASMEKAGVAKSVVLPVATNPAKVGKMNLQFAARQEEKLVFFGCAHPDVPWAEMEESLVGLARAGVKGIKLHPVYQGSAADSPENLRILEKASDLGLWTVIHAGLDIGFPGDTLASVEKCARAVKALSGGKVILAHMGAWQQWDRVAELIGPTNALIDTCFTLGRIPYLFDATEEETRLLEPSAFCDLVRAMGAARVLFGTDSPWTDQAESMANLLALPLTEEEKELILWKNAQAILS